MTHEPCPDGPEGGPLGEAWLDDAADVQPQPLQGYGPEPDLPGVLGRAYASPVTEPSHGLRYLRDRVRFWASYQPVRLVHRALALVGAGAGSGLYVNGEETAAVVAGVATAAVVASSSFLWRRVVPTMATLPPEVLERLEARWRQEQGR